MIQFTTCLKTKQRPKYLSSHTNLCSFKVTEISLSSSSLLWNVVHYSSFKDCKACDVICWKNSLKKKLHKLGNAHMFTHALFCLHTSKQTPKLQSVAKKPGKRKKNRFKVACVSIFSPWNVFIGIRKCKEKVMVEELSQMLKRLH